MRTDLLELDPAPAWNTATRSPATRRRSATRQLPSEVDEPEGASRKAHFERLHVAS